MLSCGNIVLTLRHGLPPKSKQHNSVARCHNHNYVPESNVSGQAIDVHDNLWGEKQI